VGLDPAYQIPSLSLTALGQYDAVLLNGCSDTNQSRETGRHMHAHATTATRFQAKVALPLGEQLSLGVNVTNG
jgi:hypothetical protein